MMSHVLAREWSIWKEQGQNRRAAQVERVQQLGGGQSLAQRAGAEGRILGLDLAQERLACPGAMLAHLEKNQHHGIIWHNCGFEHKVKQEEMNLGDTMEYTLMRMLWIIRTYLKYLTLIWLLFELINLPRHFQIITLVIIWLIRESSFDDSMMITWWLFVIIQTREKGLWNRAYSRLPSLGLLDAYPLLLRLFDEK